MFTPAVLHGDQNAADKVEALRLGERRERQQTKVHGIRRLPVKSRVRATSVEEL